MPVIWSILLVAAGLFALVAGIMLATGNKPWSNDSMVPTSPPADPGAEGMLVSGPGDISPGDPHGGSADKGRRRR
jgi:hypothetical protein